MRKIDYLIVGQGIAGTLMAWELYKGGLDFMMVSSTSLPSSSTVAGGLFNPLVFRNLHKTWMVDDFLPEMYATYDELEQFFDTKLVHRLNSYRLISTDEIPKYSEAKEGGLSNFISILGFNTSLAGVKLQRNYAEISHSGYVDGALLIDKMAAFLIEKGVLFNQSIDYKDVFIRTDGVEVNGIQCRKVIFCEGAHAANNPWFNQAGLSTNKGELIEIYAPGLREDYVLRGDVFVLPVGNSKFKVGATYSRECVDSLPSEDGLRQLLDKLGSLISVPFEVINHAAGVRPGIKDRKPVLGPHPDHPDLFIFNGLGSRGFIQGPYWAKHLFNWLSGNTAELRSEVDVRRYLSAKNIRK